MFLHFKFLGGMIPAQLGEVMLFVQNPVGSMRHEPGYLRGIDEARRAHLDPAISMNVQSQSFDAVGFMEPIPQSPFSRDKNRHGYRFAHCCDNSINSRTKAGKSSSSHPLALRRRLISRRISFWTSSRSVHSATASSSTIRITSLAKEARSS